MKRTLRTNVVLMTGMTLLLAACGASATSGAAAAPGSAAAPNGVAAATLTAAPPAGQTADACALLTQADVDRAFKETMMAPAASVDHGDATCSWTHEAGGLDLTVSISSRPSTAAAIHGMVAAYGGAGAEVAGVGDAAFEFAGILEFVKGTTLVTIGTGDGPAIITDADFQALTKIAAGRI